MNGIGGIFSFLRLRCANCRPFSSLKLTTEGGIPKNLLNLYADTIPLNSVSSKINAYFKNNATTTSTLPPQVLINCLRNNIFIHVSTQPGHDEFTLNAGMAGFRGTQKTSQKAALAMMDRLKEWLRERRIEVVRLNFRGINSARAIIVGQLRRLGLRVTEIVDTTGIPFNGCRPPKKRRL